MEKKEEIRRLYSKLYSLCLYVVIGNKERLHLLSWSSGLPVAVTSYISPLLTFLFGALPPVVIEIVKMTGHSSPQEKQHDHTNQKKPSIARYKLEPYRVDIVYIRNQDVYAKNVVHLVVKYRIYLVIYNFKFTIASDNIPLILWTQRGHHKVP